MIHEMKLQEIYFNMIKTGTKKYEGRLNDEKRQQICLGDIILFKNANNYTDTCFAKVEDLIYFESFLEMANILPLNEVGFENISAEDASDIYHNFYSYEDEKKYGVVAIKLQVIK